MLAQKWSTVSEEGKSEDIVRLHQERGGGSFSNTELTLLEAVEKEKASTQTKITPYDLRERELSKRLKLSK